LKEVAGSNLYDEKKEESRVILKETEEKRQNIVEVLKAIEDRLTQLEVEKEELKEFQKWDKMKRSIEYTIHNKELENTQNKLNELQKMRSENSNQSNEFYEKLNSVGEQVKVIEKSIRYLFNPLFHNATRETHWLQLVITRKINLKKFIKKDFF
jgi:structural maintenance of chromosome 3 (chondroitin sulfate proteoglycan 6)